MKLAARSEGCPLCPFSVWTLEPDRDLGVLMIEHVKAVHSMSVGSNPAKRLLETQVFLRRN